MKSKKKLPRAVTRTAEDMRTASVMPSKSAKESSSISNKADFSVIHKLSKEMDVTSTNSTNAVTPAMLEYDGRRLAKANAIVERYANFASIGGVIPLPLVNVAGITAITLRMVKSLCSHYAVPYDQGRARAVAVSLAAGTVPSTAALVTSSTLVYFVPGVNLLGLAVSSVTASICTRAVGHRFVQHFEAGATLLDFPVIERRQSRPM